MSDTPLTLNEINKKLTTGKDLKDDACLMIEAHHNWEEKIMPAPYTIAILGQLIVISSMTDFKLQVPDGGFKHVRWSGSFRACLAQISGEGYKTFNMAHNAMDEIRQATGEVPGYMKDAVSILVNGNDFDVRNTLPVVLGGIESIALTCKERSDNVVNKFQSVMETILELQQACVQTHSSTESELKQLNLAIIQQKLKQDELEKNKERFDELYKKTMAQMDKSYKEYDKAMKDLPTGGDILKYNFVDRLTDLMMTPLEYIKSQYQSIKTCVQSTDYEVIKEKKKPYSFEDSTLFHIGCRLKKPVEALTEFFDEQYNLKKIPNMSELQQQLVTQKFILSRMYNEIALNQSKLGLKEEIVNACKKALSCYEDIERSTGIDLEELQSEIKSLSGAVLRINTTCTTALDRDLLEADLPMKRKQLKGKDSVPTAQQVIRNAHFKIEAASERLTEVEKNFSAAQENMLKNSDEMTKALSKMAEFDSAKATTEEVIQVLREGISQLGELHAQWSKMSSFFEQIAVIIKTTIHINMQKFIKYSSNAGQSRLQGYGMSDAMRDIIYKATFEAVKYSYLVHHMASGYFNTSDKYLMPSVSSLGKLLSIRKPEEIQAAQLKLTQDCEETVEEIKLSLQKHNIAFKAKLSERINRIKDEFNSVLPPISNENRLQIQELVQQGIQATREIEGTDDISDFQ